MAKEVWKLLQISLESLVARWIRKDKYGYEDACVYTPRCMVLVYCCTELRCARRGVPACCLMAPLGKCPGLHLVARLRGGVGSLCSTIFLSCF